jgi:HAD superfamily hydrolase (TIGR01509 family)
MARPLIALDLGGVVIDVAPLVIEGVPPAVLEQAFFGHEHHGAPEHVQVSLGRLPASMWLGRVAGRLDRPTAEIDAAWRGRLALATGADALFDALGDAEVVIWSNTDPVHFAHLAPWLPPALTANERHALSYELDALKPGAGYFAAALGRLARPPVLFVDDTPANVDAAHAAGVTAALARGPLEALEHVRRALAGGV